MGSSPAIFLWLLLQQMISGTPVGDNDFSDPILVIAGLIFGVGFPVFMYNTGLDTEVCEDGIPDFKFLRSGRATKATTGKTTNWFRINLMGANQR